jgi:Fic family protein
MRREDFSRPSGQLIEVSTGPRRFLAFVPSPLPPHVAPTFHLMKEVESAGREMGELNGTALNLPQPQLLIGPLIRREAVLSSKIEGTQTDVLGLYEFEAKAQLAGRLPLISDHRAADQQEVYNYVKALDFGVDALKTRPMTLRLIRELHEILMTGVRGQDKLPGEFRKSQNMIGGVPGEPDSARFMPPPVTHLLSCLDAFEKYIHSTDELPALVRLALLHYQFEAIHPFLDGNGRIGRLLLSLVPIAWGILQQPLFHVSGYLERNREQYCALLYGVSSRSEWLPWISFFLDAAKSEAQNARGKARSLVELQAEWRRKLQAAKGSKLALQVADALFERPFTWASDVEERFHVSKPTALSALRILESHGLVTCRDWGSGYLFFAEPIAQLCS